MKCSPMIVYKYIFFVLAVSFMSCKNEPKIPIQHESLSLSSYSKYSQLLKEAYLEDDYYTAGIQLANLKVDKARVFKELNKGIRNNPEKCYGLYDPYRALLIMGHQTNIVKVDSLEFIKTINLCFELLGSDSYGIYFEKRRLEYEDRIGNRPDVDSTKLNMQLIKEFEQIRNDDQSIRLAMNNVSDGRKYATMLEKRNYVDSVNLVKVVDILREHGCPGPESIGYGTGQTLWLVLHHQVDLGVRDKYESLVAENMGDGALEVYRWRSQNIRDEMATGGSN